MRAQPDGEGSPATGETPHPSLPISVVLADDHALYRQSLRLVLGLDGDIDVVGEASNGYEAMDLAADLKLDIIVLDLQMPRLDGVGAIRTIVEKVPAGKVVMLTMSEATEDLLEAMRAGARGYLLKSSPAEEVLHAIRDVHSGRIVVSPSILLGLLSEVLASDPATVDPRLITDRVRDLLRRRVRGTKIDQIAEEDGVHPDVIRQEFDDLLVRLREASDPILRTAPPMTQRVTLAAARRIALAAQGFARPRPPAWTATTRDLTRVGNTLHLIQIDSVNVLTRSHYLPFFSRLGPYDTTLLDRLRDRAPRRLVEYWGHEASLMPPQMWPLFRFRRERAQTESWAWMQEAARDYPHLLDAIREEVATRGPLTARELEAVLAHDHDRERNEWGWNWSIVKRIVEHLFWAGEVASAGRTQQFERLYALPERVFPPAQRHLLTEELTPLEAYRGLIERAARAHGIASELCLRDYARIKVERARPAIESLVEDGVLRPVTVEGWKRPAYLHRDARRPREVNARALLSPFDSLIWQRERVEALFDFYYRLEIYTKPEERVHGYYVLPFLLDDRLIGRVDLKADRSAGVLRVQRLSFEPGRGGADDRSELEAELDLMADWLRLGSVASS